MLLPSAPTHGEGTFREGVLCCAWAICTGWLSVTMLGPLCALLCLWKKPGCGDRQATVVYCSVAVRLGGSCSGVRGYPHQRWLAATLRRNRAWLTPTWAFRGTPRSRAPCLRSPTFTFLEFTFKILNFTFNHRHHHFIIKLFLYASSVGPVVLIAPGDGSVVSTI